MLLLLLLLFLLLWQHKQHPLAKALKWAKQTTLY
jgi:hypothetical protein